MAVVFELKMHLCVQIQSGQRCLLSKILFAPVDITFTDLFAHVSGGDHRVSKLNDCVIEKVKISDRRGTGGVEVELGALISLCNEFDAKYVTYFVTPGTANATVAAQTKPVDALEVLMRSSLPASIVRSSSPASIVDGRCHPLLMLVNTGS